MDRSLFTSFGLRENPFSVSPDPRHLFPTVQAQKAFDALIGGIQSRQGLILLTGDVGTGKTTLVNSLLGWLEHNGTPRAFVINSHLEAKELFELMLADFDVPADPQGGSAFSRLNAWLLERHRVGQTAVLVIDEAQGLPSYTFEEIRLLLNLEAPNGKLLQIVLSGQTELEQKLKRLELRQIHQRIAIRCKTRSMTLEETRDCIQHRLRVAGAENGLIFSSEAMDRAFFYSRGIPRVINLLCEHALLKAHAAGTCPVTAGMIEDASRELQFDSDRPIPPLSAPEVSMPHANLISMQPAFGNSQMAFAAAAGSSMDRLQDANNFRVGDLAVIGTCGRNPADKAAPQPADSGNIASITRKPEPLVVKAISSGYDGAFAAGAQEHAHSANSAFPGSADISEIMAELSWTAPATAPTHINSSGPRRSSARATVSISKLLKPPAKIAAVLSMFDAPHRTEFRRRILDDVASVRSQGRRLFKQYTEKTQPVLARMTSSFISWLKEPVPWALFARSNPKIRNANDESFGWLSSWADNLRDRAEPVLRWLQAPARPAHRR